MVVDVQKLIGNSQVTAVADLAWGDGGKGKLLDLLAGHFDSNWRTHGGANAGNTVYIEGIGYLATHLLPPGIGHDKYGILSVIGQGVAVDIDELTNEVRNLDRLGLSYNGLRVSRDAPVVMPFHIIRDQNDGRSQEGGGIGTTGRGIGPCYTDDTARRGIYMRDLQNEDVLRRKLEKLRVVYNEQSWNIDKMIADLQAPARFLRPFITDTTRLAHELLESGKTLLLLQSHGGLISGKHGASPYVTTSDCSMNGVATGAGISARVIDQVFGIVKFPFTTRVGGGPFVTELGGRRSEEYCRETDPQTEGGKPTHRKEVERARHPNPIELMNDADDFVRGVGIRIAAGEYGATTTRPRRIGWSDLVAMSHAVRMNGDVKLFVTKPDCLEGIESFKVCHTYKYASREKGDMYSRDPDALRAAEGVYCRYNGYGAGSVRNAQRFDDLPEGLLDAMRDMEEQLHSRVVAVSTGPEAEQTIVR